jgi:hypothetical protein
VSTGAFTRNALRVLLVLAVMLGAFTVRVVTSAKAELEVADRRRASGEMEAAIVHYRRAARWYAPFSPLHVHALHELASIAADAEYRGDVELALSGYRAIRSSILATRSLYVPEQARLNAANKRIAVLMSGLPAPPMDAGKSREQLEREHLVLLQANPDPKVGWTLVLLLGFVAWVSGAFLFTLRAIDEEDRFVRREALRWGSVIVLGFAAFVLGMALA